MKTLTTTATLATGRPEAAPLYLLQIDFTAPAAKTLRFADRYVAALNQEWLPYVASWGNLEEALNTLDPDGRPATAQIALINTKPIEGKARVSDLIRTPRNTLETYEWAFAKVTITQLFDGLGIGDQVVLGVFYLEDPTEIGEDVLTLRMTDQALVLEDAMKSTLVERSGFPYAATAALKERIPWLIGVLRDVPAIPVVDGAITRLTADLSASATTVSVHDSSGYDGSGTIQIDTEQITYTGNTGTSFTGCTRGANGTLAVAHSAPAEVLDVRTGSNAYRFAVGEHTASFKTKAVTNIKVNGQPPRTSPTVTLDETALVSGKRFAVINFTPSDVHLFHTLPAGENRLIAVSALTVTGDGATYVASATRTIAVGNPSEAGGRTTRKLTWKMTRSSGAWAATNAFTINRRPAGSATWVQITYQWGNGSATEFGGTDTQEFPGNDDEEIFFTALLGSGVVATLTFLEYAVAWARGGAGGDSTSARVIGQVTCDVEGIKDDAAGTLSGTPSLLLENPVDVARFILTQLYSPALTLGATLATTRAILAGAGYTWATRLEFMPFAELRKKLGEQASAALFLEGDTWQFKYLDAGASAQLTLDYTRDVWDGLPARVSRTSRTAVRTRLIVSSERDWSRGGATYRRVKPFQDLTQVGFPDPIEDELRLDFVQQAATADALGIYWLAWRKRQHFVVDLVAFWNILAMEKIDYLAISNHPVLSAHGGESLVFRIVGKSYLAGDENPGRIRLRAVEV